MKYDNWEITGRISKQKIVKYFSVIKKYLLRKGKDFEFLLEGKIKIVKKIPNQPSDIAGYCYKSGLIAITRDVVEENDYNLFLHELGHLFWSYLYASQERKIERKYNQLMKKAKEEAKKIKLKKGDFLIRSGKRNVKCKGKIEVISYKNNTLRFYKNNKMKIWRITKRIEFISDEILFKGKKVKKEVSFPTMYSTTNYYEFFCEMFSLWVMGKLKKENKKWFESLIKS
jgi:hypothetical protein